MQPDSDQEELGTAFFVRVCAVTGVSKSIVDIVRAEDVSQSPFQEPKGSLIERISDRRLTFGLERGAGCSRTGFGALVLTVETEVFMEALLNTEDSEVFLPVALVPESCEVYELSEVLLVDFGIIWFLLFQLDVSGAELDSAILG